MSQFSTPSAQVPPATQNQLGFIGFICSVLGFVCSLGLLCPVGLVLSLIGLRRNPRGFAIAGSIIGALGTLMCILLIVVTFLAVGIAKGIGGAIRHGAPFIKSVIDGESLRNQIEHYKAAHGAAPKSLEELQIDGGALLDGWGHKFRYQLNEDGTFSVTSDGPDGKQGTLDDIRTDSNHFSGSNRGRRSRGSA